MTLLGAGEDVDVVKCPSTRRSSTLRADGADCVVLPVSDGGDRGLRAARAGGRRRAPCASCRSSSTPPSRSRAASARASTSSRRRVNATTVSTPERLVDETALHLHRMEARLPAATRKLLSQLRTADSVFHGKRILIVDDDIRNVFALTSALEMRGMKVVYAENGREGVTKLRETSDVDLVLLDVMMPEMDGYETARAIRGMSRFDALPIISLTAKAMKGDRDKCIAAGASDYITKPVDVDQLLSLMRVWLHRLDDTPSVLLVDDRPENLLALAAVLEPLQVRLRHGRVGRGGAQGAAGGGLRRRPARRPDAGDGRLRDREVHPRARAQPHDADHLPDRGEHRHRPGRPRLPGGRRRLRPQALRAQHAALEGQRLLRPRAPAPRPRARRRDAPAGVALAADRRRAVDADGRLLRANPVLQKLTEGRAVNGVAVSTLVKQDDRLALDALLTAALAGATVPPAAELQLAGDEDLPVSILAWGVREHDGEILSVLIQVDDLRERRRAEAARERLAEERAGRAQAEAAYERERTIASTLQRDLLPRRLPDAPGVALAAHFSAGGEGTAVGGDWFDAFTLPGGRLGLVIGDVAGRGVAAAARMGQLRSVARAYAVEGHPPVDVVARLNLYHQALRADDMTTLIYAVIEPDRGRLRLVNAGHPPPALVLPGSSARLLEGSCPALGIAEICRAPEIVVDFPPGATLALFTDGLIERRHEGIDAGLARLLSALAGAPGDVDAVRDDVIEACLGPERVDDDVTALFVRAVAALGETVRLTLTPDARRAGRPAAHAAPLAHRDGRRARRDGRHRRWPPTRPGRTPSSTATTSSPCPSTCASSARTTTSSSPSATRAAAASRPATPTAAAASSSCAA